MDIVMLLCKQNLTMFIYLLIGCLLFKKKFLSIQGSGDLGRLLLYVIMPTAILKSYLAEFSKERLIGLGISFLAACGTLILSIVISRVVFRCQSPVRQFGAAFSNAGFLGIPLVQITLGEEAVFYVASFVAVLNILQWTYGVYLITGDKENVSVYKICTNPIVISFCAGILLFLLPIQLPEIITNTAATLASMNGPLAMIVLGTYLAQIHMKELFSDRVAFQCAIIRLLLIPGITVFFLLLVPQEYQMIRHAVLIASAAPVGSNVAIFAQLYGKSYKDAVKDICLSTLLCIVSMPVILGAADYIWKSISV